jgi:hypothetical protein
MQKMWAVDYNEIKVYGAMAEPLCDQPYWYVDDGWCGKMGDTLFYTRKEGLDHLLRYVDAERRTLVEKYIALIDEWCHAED